MTTFQFIAGMLVCLSALAVKGYLVMQSQAKERASRTPPPVKVIKTVLHEKF